MPARIRNRPPSIALFFSLTLFLAISCTKASTPSTVAASVTNAQGGGNADGWGGGDASTLVENSFQRVQTTLGQLAAFTQSDGSIDPLILGKVQGTCTSGTCGIILSADPSLVALAVQFISASRSEVQKSYQVEPIHLFSFLSPLIVNGVPVVAATPFGTDGFRDSNNKITSYFRFDDAKVLGLSTDLLDMYTFHEGGHKASTELAAGGPAFPYLTDAQTVSSNGHSLTGRDFLNLAGACIGRFPLSYRAVVQTDSPIGYWRLEDAEGSSRAMDSSGNHYDASYVGKVTQQVPLPLGPELLFGTQFVNTTVLGSSATSGDSSVKVNLPSSISLENWTTFEFMMNWNGSYDPDPVTPTGTIVSVLGFAQLNIGFYDGSFGLNTFSDDIWGMSAEGLANNWVHVVAEINNNDVKQSVIFVNGARQTLTQRRQLTPAGAQYGVAGSLQKLGSFNISGNPLYPNYRFPGKLAHVSMYDKQLTPPQVQAHFLAAFQGK